MILDVLAVNALCSVREQVTGGRVGLLNLLGREVKDDLPIDAVEAA